MIDVHTLAEFEQRRMLGLLRWRFARPNLHEGADVAMTRGRWVYTGRKAGPKPPPVEKSAITAACEKLIAEKLKPRCMPMVRPTEFNYPVDIRGGWYGNKYRFITRYRSGFQENRGAEFDVPFARIAYVSRDCFDLAYRRHTDEWLCLHRSVSLERSLKLISLGEHFAPF